MATTGGSESTPGPAASDCPAQICRPR